MVERIMHLPRRILREAMMVIQLVRFYLLNRFGTKAVTEPDGPVVSLTTYGSRATLVQFTIESIAAGQLLPSRLILWVDNNELFQNLPKTIQRLQKRGLEVKLCKNYGPHKKYYPYVETTDKFDTPLVIADDDSLYPRYWLRRLVEASQKYPECLNCWVAHRIQLGELGLDRFASYPYSCSTQPSFLHIAIGACGIMLPPRLLSALKSAGTAFQTCCPKQDDLWIHVWALRCGYRTRTITARLPYLSFREVPGTQRSALKHENVDRGDGNDRASQAVYSKMDISLLRNDGV
jgi:hypothetical protein